MDSSQPAPLAVPIPGTQNMLGGISRTSVYELVKSGQLQKIRIGKRSLITVSSIYALVDRLTAQEAGADEAAAGEAGTA
jgi:hypothetical protein